MEAVQEFVLANVLLCAGGGAFALVVLYMLVHKGPKDAPVRASVGIPVLGNVLGFVNGPLDIIKTCYDKYGPVFTIPILGKPLTFLIGPEAQGPFFKSNDDILSQNEVYGFMKPVFGADVVYDAEPKKRNQQMQAAANGLRPARLKAYVAKIEKETQEFFKSWGNEGEVDILEALSELTILTASRCLHGDDVRENMFTEVSRLYHDLDKGITPVSFFFPNAPLPAHFTRNKARKEMCALFSKVIAQRRAEQQAGADLSEKTDLLQVFMDMKYKEGGALTDDQITGLLIALLFAGQHTSSISSTWTTLLLAQHPELMKRVLAEQTELVGDKSKAVEWDALQGMELLHNCMREALRLFPPLIMLMRQAKQDFKVTSNKKEFTVPKGHIVFASPAVAMRIPEVFPKPDEFDPDRFMPPREEHKAPYAYLGFGAGMHQCMGQQFGFVQVKTIMSILLRNFEIELLPGAPFPERDFTAMVVGPKGPCMVRYKRRI